MSEELHEIEVEVSGEWQTVKVTKEQLENIRSGTPFNASIKLPPSASMARCPTCDRLVAIADGKFKHHLTHEHPRSVVTECPGSWRNCNER